MEHVCSSEGCRLPLRRGDRVVQMLRGKSYPGYITPAFADILAEWHENCFHEFILSPQTAPYRCQVCQELTEGDDIVCFVIGQETGNDHSVSERRGYELYSVRHVDCQMKRR
jgi:hypothetical protein